MKTKTTFTSKLGTSKGTARSRIWLQGKRLIEAGFTPGTQYGAMWYSDRVQLLANANPEGHEPRKVSGKGDLPIIDIVGAAVVKTFGKGTHVSVSFDRGVITIRRAS